MIVRSHASGQGRLVGGLIFVAGLWGALIPFVGPSFGYGMGRRAPGTGVKVT